MNEQVLSALRNLPREKLEDLANRAMAEVRISRTERAPNSYFYAVLSGFVLGTIIAVSGFVIGASLR
jgi:hypothetical protein